MASQQRKQIALAQNFLKSTQLVRRLLAESTIKPSDTVMDIGAGRGMLTAELGAACAQGRRAGKRYGARRHPAETIPMRVQCERRGRRRPDVSPPGR